MKIPNVSPRIFSSSAVIVGYLLIDDLDANEQNALGNWLMLVAQVICTNAVYKQMKNGKINNNGSINEAELLKKLVDILNKEIDNLKNSKL